MNLREQPGRHRQFLLIDPGDPLGDDFISGTVEVRKRSSVASSAEPGAVTAVGSR